MDPPWENHSAHRADAYPTMKDAYELFALPIADLLKPGGLVGVWVTNKMKYVHLLKEKLFKRWGLQCIAEWYWIKVCFYL
jgi:N6-adenosine-specific RNA methylase IME4